MPDEIEAVWPATDAGEDPLVARLAGLERGDVEPGPDDGGRAIDLLSHDSPKVRRHAAGAVATMLTGGQISTDSCRRVLSSGSDDARWGAAFALARSGFADDSVVDVALACLESADGDRRWAAEAVLVDVARGSAPLRARLRELATNGTTRSRKMALLCLCDSGERDGVLFRSALADPDPFVRMAGLTSLARGGDRSNESLSAISNTADGDEDARVRRAAAAVHRRLTAHEQGKAS